MRDVHRLSNLGVRLEDSSGSGFMVHDNSKSSLVVEVKSKQHLEKSLMEFKETVLGKLNEAFSLGGWYFNWIRVHNLHLGLGGHSKKGWVLR